MEARRYAINGVAVRTRRALLGLAAIPPMAAAAMLGDANWAGHLETFIDKMNAFIHEWNRGILDPKQWRMVEKAWKGLER